MAGAEEGTGGSAHPTGPGQVLWLEGVIYRPEGWPFERGRGGIAVNLLVLWKERAKEPWYVVTTLATAEQATAYYRRRMRLEEGFRDWKQRLGLRQAAVSTVERMARLMVGLVLATLVLALLGLFGVPEGFRRAVLGRGKGSARGVAVVGAGQAAGAGAGAAAGGKARRGAMNHQVERRQPPQGSSALFIFSKRTSGEAWARLADALDELHIPQPNLVFCTSELPEDPAYAPRLQCFWKIVPLYVGDIEARWLWRETAGMLADRLRAAGFEVDRGASTNLVGFMRLPGSVNTKTGTRVEPVGPTHDLPFTLSELLEAGKIPTQRPGNGFHRLQPMFDKATKRGKLTELPQLKRLARGVPETLRNLALYGLAKALWADGVSLEEAIEWALAWNERCDPPEDPFKIRDVVQRCYGACGPQAEPENFTGIDPKITAAVFFEVTGVPVDPDPRLKSWFPPPPRAQVGGSLGCGSPPVRASPLGISPFELESGSCRLEDW